MSLGYIGENIPTEWVKPLLTDLANPKQWKTISTKNLLDEGYVVYGANGKIGFYHEFTHENPTLMITCRGATCGNLHISEPYSYINGNAMALDELPVDLVGVNFLRHALEARSLEDTISGSAQPQITRQGLSEVRIPLPSLIEQKIIAEKLDALLGQVEATKTLLKRIPQILKRFRQSVLAAAVSGKLTEEWRGTSHLDGWKDGALGDFIGKPKYGSSSKSMKDGRVPVLRMGNLQDGRLDWSDLVYSSDLEEIYKYNLEPGDVLFNRTNSPELVGKTAIYRGEREAIYAGYLICVKCLPGLNPEFLNYNLNSPKAKDYCKAVKSDGVSQSNINAKKLAAYPMSCPPEDEQAEIVRRVDQLFAYADTIEKQVNAALERVNNLTQSILAKAFRGELTAQWRAENPELISGENSAEALLERIKVERAAQAPKKRGRKAAI